MKKTLLSQLHNLKDIQPDKQWKTDSQDFLRVHISDGVQSGVFSKLMVWVKDFAKVSSQPAFALAAFVLILITGVAFFNPLLSDAKPNDSLYIARIISEKAQVNMTFNKESRDKLSAQFATNHAKDITNLMNDPDFHSQEGSQEKIANLSEDFNNEINSARASINSINERERNTYINNSNNNIGDNVNDSSSDDSDLDSENSDDSSQGDDEGSIFSADTKKDDKGLEINVKDDEGDDSSDDNNNDNDNNIEINNETNTADTDTATNTEETNATDTDETTDENVDVSAEEQNASSTLNELQSITKEVSEEGEDVNETNNTLDDAQRLFNEEKYQEALEKLNEVEKMLEGVSSGISEEPSVE